MISDNFQKLFEEAKKVREKAYVPYSQFKVGAAFLTEDKSIVVGCNVENAAYPQSQCAEASAIGNLISQGYKKIVEKPLIKFSNYFNEEDSILLAVISFALDGSVVSVSYTLGEAERK